MPAARLTDFGSQGESVFNQLCGVESGVKTAGSAQRVSDFFVALHAASPAWAPIGFGKLRGSGGAERFEALGFDADECGARCDEAIEHGMAAAGPRETDCRLERHRPGRPCRLRAIRQRRQIAGALEKIAECVGGQSGRGFGAVEFSTRDFVAGGGVEYALDRRAGNAGKESGGYRVCAPELGADSAAKASRTRRVVPVKSLRRHAESISPPVENGRS